MDWIRIFIGFVAVAWTMTQCVGPIRQDVESDTDGHVNFPIGLFGPGPVSQYQKLADLGFNTIVAGVSSEVLDGAFNAGLSVVGQAGTQAGSGFNSRKAAESINLYDVHPALKAWYVVDEPAFNKVDPKYVSQAAEVYRQAGATKPLAITMWFVERSNHYMDAIDILMVDRYPIPWMPVSDLGQHVRLGKLAAGHDKPVWAIIQAFSWEAYPDQMPHETNLRPPSYAELRAMVFDAVAQGAEGILFFGYQVSSWNLEEHPGVWASIQIVVDEIRKYLPILTGRRIWKATDSHYKVYSQRFNARGFSAISLAFFEVSSRLSTPGIPPGIYLLAVNTTELAQELTLRIRDLPASMEPMAVPRLTDQKTMSIEDQRISERFDPLEVHVYGPFP